MTARVRPITVMAAAALVAVVLVAAFAWTRDDDAVVGQPAALPILVGARAEAALAPVSTVGSRSYVRGSGLADPGGPVAAWSVAAADPDPADVRRLADVLGVSGDLRVIAGGWQIGADGEAAVRVAELPGSRWDYSPGGPPQVAIACASPSVPTTIPVPDSTTTSVSDLPLVDPAPDLSNSSSGSGDVGVDGCTSTPAPEGIPSASEAEAATRDLLHRAGVDVAHMRLSATSGAWGAQVDAVPELDGIPAFGLETVFSFGAEAEITSAYGWLADPVQGDDYPLIGIDAAIDRANEGRDVLDGFVPMPLGVAVDDSSSASGSGSSGSGSSGSDAGSGSAVSSGTYPPITGPATTISMDDPGSATVQEVTTPATTTDWVCGVPLPLPPAADGEESSGGGPSTTTTVVGVGAGDAGGSTGSGASCPGSVCPAPPCPSGDACAYACAVPTCDPAACTDPYPGPTVVPEPTDPPADLPATGPVVTVTSVEVVLAAVPGSDGSLWLVPAYRLTGDDGTTITVLAVDESFVAAPSGTTGTGATGSSVEGSRSTVASEIAPLPEAAPEPATDPTAS